MAQVCQHGLPQLDCLICKTLGPPGPQATLSVPTPAPAAVQPDRVYSGRAPARRGSVGLHLGMVVAGIVVIGLVAWVVAGAVFALFHIVELLVVAAVAGWGGYRLGRFRGRHQR